MTDSRAPRFPLVTVTDERGDICDIFQAGASNRPSWRIAYEAARSWYPRASGFTLTISATE